VSIQFQRKRALKEFVKLDQFVHAAHFFLVVVVAP